jgi:pimeloyl-ACP methyl ester carboxylesterase
MRLVTLPTGPAGCLDVGSRELPAVVCVHGLPGRALDFRWLAEPLSGRGRLVALDLPGFGQTPAASWPDPSPEGRAAFICSAVEALGLDRPVLAGHSMGGVVAVAAVSARPELFRGLALLATPGLRPHASFRRVPRRTLAALARGPWAPLFRPLIRRLFALSGFRAYPDVALARTLACLRATSLEAHAGRVRALSHPTFAAWCEDDPLIEPAILAELAAALPPGPRWSSPTGGHIPQRSHPAAVAQGLAALLSAP